MFANSYLLKNSNQALISQVPGINTKIIVVIPSLREPDIRQTLDSLLKCDLPEVEIEVIVLVNHSEDAEGKTKTFNHSTVQNLKNWVQKNPLCGIRFYIVGPVELRKKWAGAGLARKKGMDEAVRRFNLLNKPEGVIVSLDADTIVEPNYLIEIEAHFRQNPKQVGATLKFKHRTDGLEKKHVEGIRLYEAYLDYYKRSLTYAGYPYAMFTVGSAFAVRAEAYVRRGGMNRRQAGEDFYFLQNLAQIGIIGEIDTTTVHPSARLSDRVPFGTGPILQRWMNGEEDLSKTYAFEAFRDLKEFFDRFSILYRISDDDYEKLLKIIPTPVSEFLKTDNFKTELDDLNRNCASITSFSDRFFQKFNAFKILKYLNAAHKNYYHKLDLTEQIGLLDDAVF